MENNQAVPEEIKGWNWGAFAFNWIWGIRFRTYRALLVFVPFVNIVMPFVLGFKGNEWAWKHNHWHSVEEFKHSQVVYCCGDHADLWRYFCRHPYCQHDKQI